VRTSVNVHGAYLVVANSTKGKSTIASNLVINTLTVFFGNILLFCVHHSLDNHFLAFWECSARFVVSYQGYTLIFGLL
jgi:hypothetical protein